MGSIFTKLLALGIGAGAIAGNSEELQRFYEEVTAQTQYVVSGMDMRNIGQMLDYEYIRKGRYPAAARFQEWMQENFKENQYRELVVDTWGTPFEYTTGERDKTFRLASAGPDRQHGTDDDLIYTGP